MAMQIAQFNWDFKNANHSRSVLSKLNELRQQAVSTDVVLCIAEKQFPCHQVVLASCSKFFMSFFYGQIESQDAAALVLEDINAQLFDIFLQYIYTGSVQLNICSVKDVLKMAEKFEVDSLIKGCKEFLHNDAQGEEKKNVEKGTEDDRDETEENNKLTHENDTGDGVHGTTAEQLLNALETTPYVPDNNEPKNIEKGTAEDIKAVKNKSQDVHQKDVDTQKKNEEDVAMDTEDGVAKQSEVLDDEGDENLGGLDDDDDDDDYVPESETLKFTKSLVRFKELAEVEVSRRSKRKQSSPFKVAPVSLSTTNEPESPPKRESGRRVLKKCEPCYKTFATIASFQKHMKNIHGEIIMESPLAKPEEVNVGNDNTSMGTENSIRESDSITESDDVTSSSASKNKANPECNICQKTFRYRSSFMKHLKTFHTQAWETVKNASEAKKSSLAERRGYRYKCSVCEKLCKSKDDLTKHVRIHTGQRPYQCAECGIGFAASSNLYKHMRVKHGVNTETVRAQLNALKPASTKQVKEEIKIENSSDEKRKDIKPGKPECRDCGKKFWTTNALVRHQRVHTGEKPYHCSLCQISFTVSSNLYKHMRVKHNMDTEIVKAELQSYMVDTKRGAETTDASDSASPSTTGSRIGKQQLCPICNISYFSMKGLQNHIKEAHPEDKDVLQSLSAAICEHCGKHFRSQYALSDHLNIHLGKRPHKCEICGMTFRFRQGMKFHLKRVHEKKRPHKCRICDKSFSVVANLRMHQVTHTKERSFLCDLCGKSFSYPQSLATHKKTHATEKNFKCELCHKTFKLKKQLIGHVQYVHDADKVPCDICGKMFSEMYVEKHKKMHLTGRDHECDLCGKKFKMAKTLKTHQMCVHNEARPYVCEICRRGFKDKYLLMKHMTLHQRPYSCTLCKQGFKTYEGLTKHMRTHKGKYSCPNCSHSFKKSEQLERHMKICTFEPQGDSEQLKTVVITSPMSPEVDILEKAVNNTSIGANMAAQNESPQKEVGGSGASAAENIMNIIQSGVHHVPQQQGQTHTIMIPVHSDIDIIAAVASLQEVTTSN